MKNPLKAGSESSGKVYIVVQSSDAGSEILDVFLSENDADREVERLYTLRDSKGEYLGTEHGYYIAIRALR